MSKRRNEFVCDILISPYRCPNVNGPVPNSTSEYVGLNLAEIIAQSSDLFNIKDIMLTNPKYPRKKFYCYN